MTQVAPEDMAQQQAARFRQLVEDIPREIKRIRDLKAPTVEVLHAEMARTVGELLVEVAQMVHWVWGHTGVGVNHAVRGLADVADRLSAVEGTLGGYGTQIAPEHALPLMSLAQGTAALMDTLIERGAAQDDATRQKFVEHKQLAEFCAALIRDHTVEDDDDDEEEDEPTQEDGDGPADPQPAAPPPAAAN